MLQLAKEIKIQLIKTILAQPDPFGNTRGDTDIIPFLERIWDLRTLPSFDDRFTTAYDDAIQHLVNNNDWTNEYIFLDRFDLLESNESFTRFLETIISPEVRQSEDEIIKYILLIEPYVARGGYTFALADYTQNGPVYKLVENTEGVDFIADIKLNKIPFFVDWNKTGNSTKFSSHQPPEEVPGFVLVFNDGWNDYGVSTEFNLFYYNAAGEASSIGEVKIITRDENKLITEELDTPFANLTPHFCSLGQNITYYTNLKKAVGKDFESVLQALRDASLFPDIQESFEKNKHFKNSLVRFDSAERALRVAKFVAYDYDLENLYTFDYLFKPAYADEPVKINFEFSKQGLMNNRIYAVIGKNGTGKTQLITSLPLQISKKNNQVFIPRTPYFSKVIAVSYSVFDQFEIPRRSSSFNYIYCGLRRNNKEPYTETGLKIRFYTSWKRIQSQGRLDSWRKVLASFIDPELLGSFITVGLEGDQAYIIDNDKFQEFRNRLSSGQSILFYIISEIIANIRLDSLLLYDEPEMHLHPNAITELIYVIYQLVEEFQSYCVIATHSPVIIRELFSRNVFVLDRNQDIPSIRPIGIESFGEDIGVLTDEVFGNKEVPKPYKRLIDQMVESGNSFDQIVSRLESEQLPLSLNTRLYIRSVASPENA